MTGKRGSALGEGQVCQWCGRAIALGSRIDGHSWFAVKGDERSYDKWLCDARDDGYSHHEPSDHA